MAPNVLNAPCGPGKISAFGRASFVIIVEAGAKEVCLAQMSDKELVAACRGGDQVASEALVRRHYGSVFGLCLALLGHGHAAEDATQEAFLKAFQQLAGLREGEQFGPWIARIARNVSLDLLRRESRTHSVLSDVAFLQSASPSQNHDLEGAIRRLPVELRGPLVLYYFGRHNAREIAEHLGISHSLACQRLREARKELHRLLTGQGGTP
jgi:RNA polymerase sigma-70 factor (ECF subfamily)